jgi:hypothetical protein
VNQKWLKAITQKGKKKHQKADCLTEVSSKSFSTVYWNRYLSNILIEYRRG